MKEKGFPLIESLMFEDHDLIKRAATECMCNMVMCEEVRNLKSSNLLKYLRLMVTPFFA